MFYGGKNMFTLMGIGAIAAKIGLWLVNFIFWDIIVY